ncbi:PadR family transcriptional regulator [Deinococcus sp.]|uniref:PadR family transcriptional regulator n=1 Tax=Deinococcus sp. TaxID=47478 RepID=UPI003CC5FFB2
MASTVLTPADLVILAVLAEGARHGYDLNAELERRDVSDWVSVSRPQVYYSLRKLADRGLLAPVVSEGSGGPERQAYAVTETGRSELALALGREDWATARPHQPFVTWLAMAAHTDEASRKRVIEARLAFVEGTIERERHTLETFAAQPGPMVQEASLMIELTIGQLEYERGWLQRVRALLIPKKAK